MELKDIKHVVFSSDLEEISFIKKAKECGINCISVIDARSAVYFATGIGAQNKEPVVVCLNNSNASRSAFSGMTEAFYRKLPVALITFGEGLNYEKELGDIVYGHYKVTEENELESLLDKELPIHIEILGDSVKIEKLQCGIIQNSLSNVLIGDEYLYIGQGIIPANNQYKCKVVKGGMPNCYEGALSNILGASLSKRKRRYIGLVSENEFLHDMNTLGNINVNDLLLYIVVMDGQNDFIINYANSLEYKVIHLKEDAVEDGVLKKIIDNGKKTVLLIYKESRQ